MNYTSKTSITLKTQVCVTGNQLKAATGDDTASSSNSAFCSESQASTQQWKSLYCK